MKEIEYKGYGIAESGRHGKCVKGKKKTTSLQIRDYKRLKAGYMILKHFSYPIADAEKKNKAIEKAKTYVDNLTNTPPTGE